MAPTKGRARAYHHGNLPSALLVATRALIRSNGVEAFSLREAARKVGVSVAAVYRHFPDRAVLLALAAKVGFEDLATRMERMMEETLHSSGPARAIVRFRALGRAYVLFAVENPAEFKLMFGVYGSGSKLPEAYFHGVGPSGHDPYELLMLGLKALREAGVMKREPEEGDAFSVWCAVHGLAVLATEGALRSAPPDEVEAAMARLIDGILIALAADEETCRRMASGGGDKPPRPRAVSKRSPRRSGTGRPSKGG